jgi:hypothetical protein
MPTTSPGFSGKYGSVLIGATEIPAYDWMLDIEMDEIDATTFMSRKGADTFAQQQMLGGIGRYNASFNVRPSALVTSTGLSVGATVVVTLKVNSGLTAYTGSMRITANTRSNDIKGATELSISCTSLTSV